MKIVHLAAGSGVMHCGACRRDAILAAAMRKRGHDFILLPLYTPLRTDDGVEFPQRLFYGGLSVYLQQISPIFSRMPSFIAGWLDSPSVVDFVSSFAIRTDPRKLGKLTISVLQGMEGRQRSELVRLIEFLREQNPDIISITNTLLSGIAPAIREHIGCKIVCSAQGEDVFLNSMGSPYCYEARKIIRRNARSIDTFLVPNSWYAQEMFEFLAVAQKRIRIVRPGFDIRRYVNTQPRVSLPFTIGYLSGILPRKGLDLLVEAVGELVGERGRQVSLKIAGQVLDKRFWKNVRRRIATLGLEDRVSYHGEVNFFGKVEFLHSLSAFCLPARVPECRGLALLEAMAAGVPVIAPFSGAFPRLFDESGGGLLVRTGSVDDIVDAVEELMDDPEEADAIGKDAATYAEECLTVEVMAGDFERVLD